MFRDTISFCLCFTRALSHCESQVVWFTCPRPDTNDYPGHTGISVQASQHWWGLEHLSLSGIRPTPLNTCPATHGQSMHRGIYERLKKCQLNSFRLNSFSSNSLQTISLDFLLVTSAVAKMGRDDLVSCILLTSLRNKSISFSTLAKKKAC